MKLFALVILVLLLLMLWLFGNNKKIELPTDPVKQIEVVPNDNLDNLPVDYNLDAKG